MIPRLKSAKAKSPATGLSASAASAAEPTSVLPCEWRVSGSAHHDGDGNQIRNGHSDERVKSDPAHLFRCLDGISLVNAAVEAAKVWIETNAADTDVERLSGRRKLLVAL